MNVSLTNEGPVTFTLDSRKFEYIIPPMPTQAVAQSSGRPSPDKGSKSKTLGIPSDADH